MLKPSYQHEKNFPNNEFQALQKLFEDQNLHVEVDFSSASIWILTWNPVENTFSGVVDISVKPKLVDQHGVVQHEKRYPRTFRVEEPLIEKNALKVKLYAFVLDEIKDLQCFVEGC